MYQNNNMEADKSSYGFSNNGMPISQNAYQNNPNIFGASAPSAPPSYNETQTGPGYYPNQNQIINNNNNKSREELYRDIILKYEINTEFANKLQMLQGFKIVFVFDDSSSMKSTLDDSPLNKAGTLLKATRWNELEHYANISIEIASIFDPNGVDVYFLNKGLVKNVKNASNLYSQFNNGPNGYTPLTNTLNSVFVNNQEAIREKKLLVILLTDGEPTDNQGNVGIREFKHCLKNRHPIDRIFITIVACTDDDESIKYLNKWDREIKNLDVVDDFRNERIEVQKSKGKNYRFSYGDYVVKSLIGSIDPALDKADEHSSFRCILI